MRKDQILIEMRKLAKSYAKKRKKGIMTRIDYITEARMLDMLYYVKARN